MANRCLGCKREIERDLQTCYICGASQSYVRYYIKSVFVVLVLISIFSGFGYWYIDKTIKVAQTNTARLTETKTQTALQKVQQSQVQFQLQLEQANKKALQAEAKATQAGELAAQLTVKLDEAEKKITEAEKKVTETEKRAGWLLKLNRQLKAQVKTLTDKASATEQELLLNKENQQEPAVSPIESPISPTESPEPENNSSD